MALYSDPPPLRPFSEDKPTLLVCWWITSFCAVIIALRVIGRFIRSEKLFSEDKTAALALVPLFLRMGCVHVILIHGTNNARLEGAALSDDQLHNKSVASGLVLLSRVFYAATLWILKYAILEFFRRLNITWRRTYDLALMFIRGLLIMTFIAVVISDLAECKSFTHYWQVLPDPGGQCRQGYAQLLTMAVCNVVTDLSLVMFPVPVILSSSMSATRKFQLVLLFSLSIAPVIVTIYRVPQIISEQGSQQTRSLYASIELLFATAAANTLVLGSFVRDRGVKKRRFKYDSVAAGSADRSSASDSRRPTALRHWGSDEDLVRDLGLGVTPELRDDAHPSPTETRQYIPAPRVAGPIHPDQDRAMAAWRFPGYDAPAGLPRTSDDPAGDKSTRSDSTATHRRVSFFDYGGLLDDQPPPTTATTTGTTTATTKPPRASASSSSASGSDDHHHRSNPSPTRRPEPTIPASGGGFRRGSAALLQDLGGFLLVPSGSRGAKGASARAGSGRTRSGSSLSPIKQARKEEESSGSPPASQRMQPGVAPPQSRDGDGDGNGTGGPQLMDVGGLLGGNQGRGG